MKKKLLSLVISMLLFAATVVVAENMNKSNANGQPLPLREADWIMEIENTTAEVGGIGHVVQINGTWAEDIDRYIFTIKYDPTMIEVTEVNADGCVGEGGYIVATYGDDWFKLYVAAIQVLAGEGKLGNLVVNITGDPGITDLNFDTEFYYLNTYNGNQYPALYDGHITIEVGDDDTPPETTCTLEGELEEDVYISDVTVTLEATDDMSGVNYTMYKLNDDEWVEYEEPFVVSDDGEHTVRYYSVDNAGNVEDEKNCTFTIEHEQPMPDLNVKSIEGGKGITVTIENNGDGNATGVKISILIEGGIFFIPLGEVEGPDTDTIPAGEEVNYTTKIFGIGLGIFTPLLEITVTAECDEGSSAEGSEQATLFLFKVTIQE